MNNNGEHIFICDDLNLDEDTPLSCQEDRKIFYHLVSTIWQIQIT